MEQQNHKEYTAEDFERYYSDQMPVAEMHALEKAALEDPFLADALDGYQYTATPAKDIVELKERLSKDKKKRSVFFLQNKTWLRIAASVILIAGIGYFTYQLNPIKKDNPVAKQIEKTRPDSTLMAKTDTAGTYRVITPSPLAGKAGPGSALTAKASTRRSDHLAVSPDLTEKAGEDKRDFAINDKVSKQVDTVSFARDTNAEGVAYFKKKESASKNDLVEGEVMDDKGNPVAFATVKDLKKNVATMTDSSGKFKLRTNDSVLAATVAATGFRSKESDLLKNKQQLIVLQPDKKELAEVVVTSMGMRRTAKSVGYSTTKVDPALLVKDSLSEPEGGWQKFNQYITDNIHSQTNESGGNYKGKVVLSFQANKSGHPRKIKITQSLCAACDKEASRLLLHGPKWKYSNGKKYEVSISF